MDNVNLSKHIYIDIFVWTMLFYISNLFFAGNIQLEKATYIAFLIWIVFVYIRTYKLKFKFLKDKSLEFLWYMFSAIAFITSIINGDSIIKNLAFLSIIPFSFFYLLRNYKHLEEIVLKSILFSNLLIVLTTFDFFNLFNLNINIQSNSMGLYLITLSIYVLHKYYYNPAYIFLVLINLLLISLTMSRTSILTFFILFFITNFMKMKGNLRDFFKVLIFAAFSIIVLALIGILFKDYIINIAIVQKFIYYSQANEIFNGRNLIWAYILENANIKGHNMNELYSIFQLGPHSNYLGILYRYGLVSALIFVIINLKLLRSAYAKNNIFRILCLIAFILCSFSEFFFTPLNLSLLYVWYIILGSEIYGKAKVCL